MNQSYFSDLFPVLAERAQQSAISRLGFSSVPLRRHLAEVFGRPYGTPGAFLADPTFEAVFGWKQGDSSMAELKGSLLSEELVRAMDNPPRELAADYRFGRDLYPYTHQLKAWKILADPTPQSLVVASGTGSGKTECFMLPILDRLIRQRQKCDGKLVGVRALFLYPLNALINSQRERLRAWTHEFGGDIRFCLYNGNTPESLPARAKRDFVSEVADRKSLRASPPPILVTNATMLEFMLVRAVDSPILQQSQGKLEWVVLDEAHTYVGSQAAEAALLIRRVLFAFGVSPEQVRFVATSATIGDSEGDAGQKLKRFLAEVAGVSSDRVHLVVGQRQIPTLTVADAREMAPLSEIASIDSEKETSARRYKSLVMHEIGRKIRHQLVGDPTKPPVARLSEVCSVLFGERPNFTTDQQTEALRWLDLLSGTRDENSDTGKAGEAFLPLRAHLFHQTMSGLWACADRNCPEKQGSSLDSDLWPFGQVFFEPRKHCDCGSPAYEIVSCGDCGTVHLLAGEYQSHLSHLRIQDAQDEFELDVEPGSDFFEETDDHDDEVHATGRQNRILITNRLLVKAGVLDVDKVTRNIVEPTDETLQLHAYEDDGNGLLCPACESQETPKNRLFQFSRLGAPFLSGGILPTLLEYAPDGEKPAQHPCRGRRLLTFSDSRQGTARMAAKLQQDAERNRVRGLVYHLTLQHGQSAATAEASVLQSEIQTLESIASATPNPALIKMIAEKKATLAGLVGPRPVPFDELAQKLANQGRDFEYMLRHYRRNAPGTFSEASGPIELARMFLVREFGRRPKRLNNLESMGLVSVCYPAIDGIKHVPSLVSQATNFDIATWRDFLKLCVDFFVRSGGSLSFPRDWRNWLGMPFPQSLLVPRDEASVARNQRRWPRAKRSTMRSVLVRLLSHSLTADIFSPQGEDRIDSVLLAAWDALNGAGLLQQDGDGRVLPLDRLAFSAMDHAWICPVTRRFLDTTLQGVTPYLPERATAATAICEKVELPLYDKPFGDVTEDLERIARARNWLSDQNQISDLREQGIWSDLNDRTIELALYFTAAEHSAQQTSSRLEQYEKGFKAGDLNLLSCSTTMEMGIDIGGISLVAMNNVPPHPANYLQRAGRAGRRRESRSLAMTLCKSNPHDQSVFENSRWAFDTILPAPRVSLDSPVIVQRHVHSLLLSDFLAEVSENSGQEQLKLNCGMFFLGDSPLAEKFSARCRGFSTQHASRLSKGLRQILRHTVFDGQNLNRVTDLAAAELDDVAQRWHLEWEQLEREELEIKKAEGESSTAFKAVALHKERLSGEYLLRELAAKGYLPAYGFPTNIAPFDNLTRDRFVRQRQRAKQGREDNRYRRRELASRDMTTALREYAPGSEVVLDGLVYRSAGVTLNWHIPADQTSVREIQDIRHAWRCSQCGASGSSHSLEAASRCGSCGSPISRDNRREFLSPAGFAVDFYKEPSNDVTSQHFVPVESPWIDADGNWYPLSNPALGRFRVTTRGHIFHQSRGIHGTGYALCLECGRSEPMQPDDSLPEVFSKPHRKLRRSKDDGLYCSGSDDTWKIKQGLSLANETWTDVFELQLRTEQGVWLNDVTTATTLAVAIRDALAELIGVQASELGCEVKPSKPEANAVCQSILIFDRYAAGYASSAEDYLDALFSQVRKRLACPANCDSACPHCVLDYDQRFAADKLDRLAALSVITESWAYQLRLPDDLAFFGESSQPEYSRIDEAIWRVTSKSGTNNIRFFAGGNFTDWDVGPSPLRELMYRLAGQGVGVELVLPDSTIDNLDDVNRHLLASLADHPNISLFALDSPPTIRSGILVAETTGSPARRWALESETSIGFGLDWAVSPGPLITTHQGDVQKISGELLSPDNIRPANIIEGDKEIEVHHQLDGTLQGFGKRLWKTILSEHPATSSLFREESADISVITYTDRYLFTPLSLALLAQVLDGLRETVGLGRWAIDEIQIFTTARRQAGDNRTRNTLWSDWDDNQRRDEVAKSTLEYLGIEATIVSASNTATAHGRVLEVDFSSGRRLTLRFDQGVSYWRSAYSNARNITYFDLNSEDSERQGERLAELILDIEGGNMPTQLFVKVRQGNQGEHV